MAAWRILAAVLLAGGLAGCSDGDGARRFLAERYGEVFTEVTITGARLDACRPFEFRRTGFTATFARERISGTVCGDMSGAMRVEVDEK